MKKVFVPLLLALLVSSLAEAQSGAPLRVSVSSQMQAPLRAGTTATVDITLTNTLPVREFTLVATATYFVGNQSFTATSQPLRLAIDDSITVSQLKLALTNLTNISIQDGAGRTVNFALNSGEVILSNLVVGQSEPLVLHIQGTVAISSSSQ